MSDTEQRRTDDTSRGVAVRRRFVAKQRDRTWWVYDTQRGSWPSSIPARDGGVVSVRSNFRSEEAADAEAQRIEEVAR